MRGVVQNASSDGSQVNYRWAPKLGTWYHVALTYDSGTGVQILYLNGVAVAANSNSVTMGFDTHPVLLGADFNNESLGYSPSGRMDEARIWNVARSPIEIQRDLVPSLTGGESGLVGYWRFNEGPGTTVADLTANANHGTFGDPQQRPTYEDKLHLFDYDSTGSYTLFYETGDVTPPAVVSLLGGLADDILSDRAADVAGQWVR